MRWWDPFESKWFLIPNLFIGILIAGCCGSHLSMPVKSLLLLSILTIGAANFVSTIWPRHSEEKRAVKLAECVSAHMTGSAVFLATDWGWTGYLHYLHERKVISLLDVAATSPNKETTVQTIQNEISNVQKSGGEVYIVDFSSYADYQRAWLQSQTGFSEEDASRWKGEPAFVCDGVRFLRLASLTTTAGAGASNTVTIAVE